jgi:ABC-type multidrug transport system ATPase subunit
MTRTLAQLQGVTVRRGMHLVLKDKNFEVQQEDIHLLVGTNGSGKSTLIETLAGLTTFEQGTLQHDGQLVADGEGRRKRSTLPVAIALQSNGVMGSETISEHLEYATSMYGRNIDQAPFLEAFSLLHRKHDLVATLSAGQRRKVAILAGILPAFASASPTMILLDEPDAGLDEGSIQTLNSWLRTLQHNGHGIVLSSHQGVFESLATHIHSLDDNTVQQQKASEPPAQTEMPFGKECQRTRPSGFGLRQQFRTMRWLSHNGLAAMMTLGVLMAILSIPIGTNSIDHLGFILAPALATGLCGDGLVVMLREERSLSWWKATSYRTPHSSWLPFLLGAVVTFLSNSILAGIDQTTTELVIVGSLLAGIIAHIMRLVQLQVEQLARPHAVFIGLLTPVLILPFALLLDFLSQ